MKNITFIISKILENKENDNLDFLIELNNSVQNMDFANITYDLIIREYYSFRRNNNIGQFNRIKNNMKIKLKKVVKFINKSEEKHNYSFRMATYDKDYIIIKTDNMPIIKDLKNLKVININDELLKNIERGTINYSEKFIESVYYVFGHEQENNIDIFIKYAEKGNIFSFFNWEYFLIIHR